MLGDAGFEVHRPVFSSEGTPDVENLYARFGVGHPHLVFAGHTDVVPPGDVARWRHDPFGGIVEGGELFGRGATDMKGGVACMMAAALAYLAEHPDFSGSIGFLITGDEEGPAVNGTVKLLDWAKAKGERFDHCILGEPTNPEALGDMIKIGRRGSLTGRLVVHGKQGHVAYPHLADNPIAGMVRLVAALKAEPLDARHRAFRRLEPRVHDARRRQSGHERHPDGGAGDLQHPLQRPLVAADASRRNFARRLHAAAGNAVRYTASFDPTNAVAFLTAPDSFGFLIEAIEAVTGRRPSLSTTGGTSDARFIKNHCPVVEFGLVGQTMHQVDERVAVADLDRLAAIYRNALERYFSPGCVPETA